MYCDYIQWLSIITANKWQVCFLITIIFFFKYLTSIVRQKLTNSLVFLITSEVFINFTLIKRKRKLQLLSSYRLFRKRCYYIVSGNFGYALIVIRFSKRIAAMYNVFNTHNTITETHIQDCISKTVSSF